MGSLESSQSMRAGQYDPKQGKCVVNNIPIPEPGPGQFLIRLASASLCHSDLLAIAAAQDQAITIGHEGAGYIHSFGPGTEDKGFKLGDSVGFLYFDGGCYKCEGCLAHNSKCLKSEPNLHGFGIDGFFQEYATVDWQNCIILPPTLDIKKASPIFCAGITGRFIGNFRSAISILISKSISRSLVLCTKAGAIPSCHWRRWIGESPSHLARH
jgi:alcohol dehydrogenase, propanol-preferring